MADPHIIDGRYEVVRVLGKGMSGQVLLVSERGSEKALKFLNPLQMNVSREAALANFKREFSILKGLNHPNIARILDFGYDEKIRKYYFTSEVILGCEFHKACEGLSLESAEKLVVQVLRALNYLHSRGIYHFDIKPQNILVAMTDGRPETAKIIDFGLAGFASPKQKVGTPAYMAPEAIQGGIMDGRTDLYSFGVMTYKILTGENPFAAKSLKDTLDNHLRVVAKPPTELNPDLPEYWNHILARLLEKKSAERYSQAALVIRDLNFLSGRLFEIETQDTKLSYLPERGALIGRDGAWQTFTRIFGDVFLADKGPESRFLIVQGGKGTGKTRLMSEIKSHAQLKGVPVRTLWQHRQAGEVPESFVLIVDEENETAGEVNTLIQELRGKKALLIWSVTELPQQWAEAEVVTLKNYTKAELKLYLESVTGLERAPENLIDGIYKRTEGNPLLVAEFIKSLLAQDLFYDANGKWDAKTFEDIHIDLDKIRISDSVEEYLGAKFSALSPDEAEIAVWLGLNGAPLSLKSLEALLARPAGESLQRLMVHDVVELSLNGGECALKNSLMGDIVRKSLTRAESEAGHSKLAALFANDPEAKIRHLYHLSRMPYNAQTRNALYALGEAYLSDAEYAKATQVFGRLIEFSSEHGGLEIEAYLKQGRAYLCLREFEKALLCLSFLRERLRGVAGHEDDLLECYQNILDATMKYNEVRPSEDLLESAEHYLFEASSLVDQSRSPQVWYLVLKNFRAYVYFKRGQIDQALPLYVETYEFWKRKLIKTDQYRVQNNRLYDIYLLKKEYDRAIEICLESLEIFEKIRNKGMMATYYYMLGLIHQQRMMNEKNGDTSEMIDKSKYYFELCEILARKIKNYPFLLRSLNGLGMLALKQRQNDHGLDYYTRALAVARKSGEFETAALISYNVATIHKDEWNYRDAHSFVVYAINAFEGLSSRGVYSEFILYLAYLVFAEIKLKMGSADDAAVAVLRADAILTKSEHAKTNEFFRSLVMAKIEFQKSRFEVGEEYLEKAKSQASSPEQKEIVAKYVASQDYKNLTKAAAEISNVANQTNVQAPPLTSFEESRLVIEMLRRIHHGRNATEILVNAAKCGMELLQTQDAALFKWQVDGGFLLKWNSLKSALTAENVSHEILLEAVASRQLIQDRLIKAPETLENETQDIYLASCLPFTSAPDGVWLLYFRHDGTWERAENVKSAHAYYFKTMKEEVDVALGELGRESTLA